MTRQILMLLSMLLFVSCSQSSLLTEKEKTVIIDSVRQTLNNYHNDIRKSGLIAEFKYLDNSADFFWVPPAYSASISYDSVASILKQNAPNYKYIDNSFDTLSIIPLSKELATYTGRLHSTMIDTNNKKTSFSLVETGVIIKRTNGWKLLSGQTSVLNQ